MAVVGVDPGLNGAMALYDKTLGVVDVQDMPTFMATVNKKKRQRVDGVALLEYFRWAKDMGAELAVIEQVGGRPKQSASGAFVFGYTVGLVMMACTATRLPVETVTPVAWKKLLRVPGGKDADDNAIMQRADDMMPDFTHMWRGKQGGRKLDRAEAAMLAYYGETFALDSVRPLTDSEFRLVYEKALGNAA